ncbi:MAG: type II toxin-antitoxin system VapC family toxin [bacterium]|nr:type II toxin-antitoxin system VapC family toxin [bacterium]
MPVLVDSNVLLDVLTEDPRWSPWSMDALAEQGDRDVLAISPIIYAEVSVGFRRIEEVDAELPRVTFHRLALPWEAAFLAGKCFVAYRKRRGVRTSPLPDFYIGAHASVSGLKLLTRDAPRYRTCFPKLTLIAPS